MKHYYLLPAFIVLSSFLSCHNLFVKKASNRSDKSISVVDSWKDSLQKAKGEFRKEFLNFYKPSHFNESWINDSYYTLSQNELNDGFEVIPVPIYTIDSAAFRQWQSGKQIESLLKINKQETQSYITKNNRFFYAIDYTSEKGQWKAKEYGPIFKNYADTLSFLYYKKHISTYQVYVEISPKVKERVPFTIYTLNGKIYCIKLGGRSALLENEFILLQNHINTGNLF